MMADQYGNGEDELAVDRIRQNAEPTDREDRFARYGRTLEFRSGPQNHTFHACESHRVLLETGDVSCFFAVKSQTVFDVDPAVEEIECDFCREG